MAYVKFLGVWLVIGLICAAILFLLTGSSDTLSSTYRLAQTLGADCDNLVAGAAQVTQEECLQGLQRGLENEAAEAQSNLLSWFAIVWVIILAIGVFFMFLIMRADETAGMEEEFVALKDSWFIYLAVIVLMVIIATFLARYLDFFGRWPINLDALLAWGLPALVGVFAVLTYWLGTRIATPSKMQPSIPLGS